MRNLILLRSSSSSSAYNPDAVVDVISDVLDAVLLYQPNNCDWLKLAGDVNFGTSLARIFLLQNPRLYVLDRSCSCILTEQRDFGGQLPTFINDKS